MWSYIWLRSHIRGPNCKKPDEKSFLPSKVAYISKFCQKIAKLASGFFSCYFVAIKFSAKTQFSYNFCIQYVDKRFKISKKLGFRHYLCLLMVILARFLKTLVSGEFAFFLILYKMAILVNEDSFYVKFKIAHVKEGNFLL